MLPKGKGVSLSSSIVLDFKYADEDEFMKGDYFRWMHETWRDNKKTQARCHFFESLNKVL